jgi:hypothetical protein
MTAEKNRILSVAVVTGGHAFDVPNFHRLFRRLDGVDAYVQPMDDFASSRQPVRDAYDAILFYHMLPGAPSDEGHPHYQGKPKTALEHLRETGQGIVVLHHAILAYPQWPTWRELAGIEPALSHYDHDQELQIAVSEPSHPVTAGLAEWKIVDETYTMPEPDPGSQVLLSTDHPHSVKAIAWARSWGQSRVLCCALGHDNQSWSNPAFERLLLNAIRWVAMGE